MKCVWILPVTQMLESPSLRRVWVEIAMRSESSSPPVSPSLRRVWVEIWLLWRNTICHTSSPSLRRVWVEIGFGDKRLLYVLSPSLRRVWVEIIFQPS